MKHIIPKALIVSFALCVIALIILALTSAAYVVSGEPPFIDDTEIVTGFDAIKLTINTWGLWSYLQPYLIYFACLYLLLLSGILITIKWSRFNA